MPHRKFDPAKLERLNDPGRFETLPPDVMWHALGEPDPSVIVEIGAGTGVFSAAFAERSPGAVLYAADTEPVMTEWMRANRPEVAAGVVVPLDSSETSVPLDDASADLVFMINLHHELADPAAIYGEAFRLLGAGGQVLVSDWLPVETPRGPSLHVRVPASTTVGMLEDAGFREVRTHENALPWNWLVTGRKPAAR